MVAHARSSFIEFRNVSKIYGSGEASVHALDRVNFSISTGEFVSIMGSSGSGKSTAMNILGCLDVPTGGEYIVGGTSTAGYSSKQRTLIRRHLMGFVFQGFHLLPRTSALENVELPLIYRHMKPARRRAAARDALELVGLSERSGHTPQQLSGGQQQRVAIARAIATNPELLLADEPTGNLDTKTSGDIMALLSRLNRELGITIIMVTHEPEMAAYADRLLYFSDGQLDRTAIGRKIGNVH